jgi:hypothetical protein
VKYVAGTVTGVGNHFTRGCIDGLAFDARPVGSEGGFLGPMDDVEYALHLIAGLSINEGTRDIGVVAFDGAAVNRS